MTRLLRYALALAVSVGIACAGSTPRPLAVGEDDCGYCRMQITDARFGGEIVSAKGKIDTFDSIECIASYYLAQPGTTGVQLFVSDFERPGQLIPVSSALFHRGVSGTTPMGQGWTATAAATHADQGAVRWSGVLEQVRAARAAERAAGTSNSVGAR